MSFKLSWNGFNEAFYENLKTQLNITLNSGPPIPNITDKLLVHNIHLGDTAPEIQLIELDPSIDHLKFTFKIKYSGNGLLELRTMVQANPIYLGSSVTSVNRVERDLIKKLRFGSASNPHIIPLSITIKDIEFDGVLSVAILNNKNDNGSAGSAGGSVNSNNSNNNNTGGGKIEAFFKEDPLKRVNIVTSFDEFPAAAKFIATLVENQLRDFITKEFPTIVGAITIPVGPAAAVVPPPLPSQQLLPALPPAKEVLALTPSNNNTTDSNSNNNSPNITSISSPQLSDGGGSINSSINSSPQLLSSSQQPPLPISPLNDNNNIDNKFFEKTNTSKKLGYIN